MLVIVALRGSGNRLASNCLIFTWAARDRGSAEGCRSSSATSTTGAFGYTSRSFTPAMILLLQLKQLLQEELGRLVSGVTRQADRYERETCACQRRRFSRMPAAPIPPPTHIVTMP